MKSETPDKPDVLAMTVREFVSAVADKSPTPGGGSVAAVVGSLSAALGRMSLAYTRGKDAFAAHADAHARLAARLERAQGMFEQLVGEDIQAYQLYVEARKLPAGEARDQALQLALATAIDVPKELAKLCLAVLGDLRDLRDKCNPHLLSDLKAGAALASAAVRLCSYNVKVNASSLADRHAADELVAGSGNDCRTAEKMLAEIEKDA
jgi:formiminotetrahydrofolate cyclodeaminase